MDARHTQNLLAVQAHSAGAMAHESYTSTYIQLQGVGSTQVINQASYRHLQQHCSWLHELGQPTRQSLPPRLVDDHIATKAEGHQWAWWLAIPRKFPMASSALLQLALQSSWCQADQQLLAIFILMG